MGKTIYAVAGGGNASANFALGVATELHRRGEMADIVVGNSGGALFSYVYTRLTLSSAKVWLQQFKKTEDVYKRNSLLRLIGFFFIKSGWYSYDGLRKELEKLPSKSFDYVDNTLVEVFDCQTSEIDVLPATVDNVISSMSILGLVETKSSYVDPGLQNVLPVQAILKVAEFGDTIYLIDGAHTKPKGFDPSKLKWWENLLKLPKYSAYNTMRDDRPVLREFCLKNEIILHEIDADRELDVYEFDSESARQAYLHGLDRARIYMEGK